MSRVRPALVLMLLSLLSAAYFVLTDPRWGYGLRLDTRTGSNPVDAIHFMQWGTYAGLIGSALVLLIGFWLLVRRPA